MILHTGAPVWGTSVCCYLCHFLNKSVEHPHRRSWNMQTYSPMSLYITLFAWKKLISYENGGRLFLRWSTELNHSFLAQSNNTWCKICHTPQNYPVNQEQVKVLLQFFLEGCGEGNTHTNEIFLAFSHNLQIHHISPNSWWFITNSPQLLKCFKLPCHSDTQLLNAAFRCIRLHETGSVWIWVHFYVLWEDGEEKEVWSSLTNCMWPFCTHTGRFCAISYSPI